MSLEAAIDRRASVVVRQSRFIALGYRVDLAEALAENNYDVHERFGIIEWISEIGFFAHPLSPRDTLHIYLEWNGIIGYTDSIIDVLDSARDREASR